jgi:hypothetical protein
MDIEDNQDIQEGNARETEHPLNVKQRFMEHRKLILMSLENIIDTVMEKWSERDDEEKKQIIMEVLKNSINHGVISERELNKSLIVEQSTVNRWRNGDTLPPKRKQILILSVIRDKIRDELQELENAEENLTAETQERVIRSNLLPFNKGRLPTPT